MFVVAALIVGVATCGAGAGDAGAGGTGTIFVSSPVGVCVGLFWATGVSLDRSERAILVGGAS